MEKHKEEVHAKMLLPSVFGSSVEVILEVVEVDLKEFVYE
jgi:hypothetical protein